ncbi:MAG: ATP-dependent DNA ligase [Patescibacteria group bacterium]|nr:ATP-dependent DNA ligase [Patescibacteria group bacterium]
MKFSTLARYFERLEQTTSRLEITQILAEAFQHMTPDEVAKTAYLLQGRVAPRYVKADFGMQEKMVVKAVVTALQLDETAFKRDLATSGDLGTTVERYRAESMTLETSDPDIADVFADLQGITKQSGPGSQETKQRLLARLVLETDARSARYLVRIPTGVLRLGLSDMTILDAYSWMLTGGKSLRKKIEAAYHVRPDLGFIGKRLKESGIEGLADTKPELFTPILMMRAERLSSGEEILEKIGPCAIEPKFDGIRLQVHYSRKSGTALFTRGLESVADTYPDIVEAVARELDVDDIIFEGEAIGYVPETREFLPFQETVQRKRKHNVAQKAKEIPLKMFVFELLYLNGESYIDRPYVERRQRINEIMGNGHDKHIRNTIIPAESIVLNDASAIEHKFEESVTEGLEGIIAKKLDGVYQAGARGYNWVKFKRSYATSALKDTLDCVVMGYDFGKGKRSAFGIGAFLVGVYDEAEDVYKTVAKIGTGLTDNEWRELKDRADRLKTETKPARYETDDRMSVDVWIKPEIVVEILADEITRSPMHTAGRTLKPSKSGKAFEVDVPGYALRFPRLQRFRDDKRVEDVTTLAEIQAISGMAV